MYSNLGLTLYLMQDVGILQQGQVIHVGGLMRLDLNQASVQTIYVTVWASPNVSLHLGKIENADEIWNKHAGVRLQVSKHNLSFIKTNFYVFMKIYIFLFLATDWCRSIV